MKLVAIMPVRNESWILGLTLRAALMWCDEVVVLDHASTDGTGDVIHEVQMECLRRVTDLYVEGEWAEMQHRQMMLEEARKLGATHIAMIDADEILTGEMVAEGNDFIRMTIQTMPDRAILQLPGYNLRDGIDQYHASGVWSHRWFSTAFKDAPDLGWSGDKFHQREPGPRILTPYRPVQQGQGGALHLWGASERRLIAKHALYKITERLRWPNKPAAEIDRMYSWAIKGGTPYESSSEWTYASVPGSWWAPYKHLMKHLDIDAEPWQEAEVRRLVAEHRKEIFAGLDLFGVA